MFNWPGMPRQIENMVARCDICNKYEKRNSKEPMKGIAKPDLPWQKVATDLFEWNAEYYVVLVDYYSSFFEVNKLQNLKVNQ